LVSQRIQDKFKKKIDQELKAEQNKMCKMLLEKKVRKKEKKEKIYQNFLELRRQEKHLKETEKMLDKWASLVRSSRSGRIVLNE